MDVLTNQEFFYRELPVEYDGTGTIDTIRGNTIEWNQLVQNGNFVDTSNWATTSDVGSISVSDNTLEFSITGGVSSAVRNVRQRLATKAPLDHVFLELCDIKYVSTGSKVTMWFYVNSSNGISQNINTRTRLVGNETDDNWHSVGGIIRNQDENADRVLIGTASTTVDSTVSLKNVMLFDLTQMFGSTKADEIYQMEQSSSGSGVAYFKNLFPLDYYQHNTGSLLSFDGEGIKTIGKNRIDASSFANENITYENGVLSGTANNLHKGITSIPISYSGQITVQASAYTDGNTSTSGNGLTIGIVYDDGSASRLRWANNTSEYTYQYATSISNKVASYVRFSYSSTGSNIWHVKDFQIEFGAEATEYQPYYSSSVSLPISTYFPSGMKRINDVYDEINSSKALQKIGMVDLGSLTWNYDSAHLRFYSVFDYMVKADTNGCAFSSSDMLNTKEYSTVFKQEISYSAMISDIARMDKVIWSYTNNAGQTNINIKDTSYTSASDFKTAMDGIILYYELGNYIETNIYLDLTYGIEEGGTEQLLPINTDTPSTTWIDCDITYRGMIPVNATVNPTGSGTISGTGDFRYHSYATLTATTSDSDAYQFLHWESGGETVSTDSTYVFEVE